MQADRGLKNALDKTGPPADTATVMSTSSHPGNAALRIKAEVFRKDWSPNPMQPGNPAYLVRVEIRNPGEGLSIFQAAKGGFLNARKQGLRVNQTAGKAGQFEVPPGESLRLDFETNGYTPDLLRDARVAGPLRFELVLLREERIFQGPWEGELPPLETLPAFADPDDPFGWSGVFPAHGAHRQPAVPGVRLRMRKPFPPPNLSLN